MLSSCIRTIDPTSEPVTVAQALQQSRITTQDDNALVAIYLQAAREYCEVQTNRAFLQQTWRASYSHFPRWHRPMAHGDYGGWYGSYGFAGYGSCSWPMQGALILPRPRLIGIVNVQYLDINGVLQTLDPSQYLVNPDAEPATISPALGCYWPPTQPGAPNAVQVTYTAGYGNTAAAVPGDLQLAIMLLAAHWYENREASVMPLTGTGPVEIPLGVQQLLAQYSAAPVFTYEEG